MTDVSHHQIRGEGVFRDQQHRSLYVHIQCYPGLTLRTKILLQNSIKLSLKISLCTPAYARGARGARGAREQVLSHPQKY